MEFKVRDDINVRNRSLIDKKYKDYKKEDIAKFVAFYLDLILSVNDDKIGVGFGLLTLQSVAFMLALHKSGKEYTLLYHKGDHNFDDKKEYCDKIFLVGTFGGGVKLGINQLIANNLETFILTDTPEFELSALLYHRSDDLIFNFDKNKKTYVVIDKQIELLYPTEKIEGNSISAAMDNYFHEDDYCVLTRPFSHFGVATLSIYPAFFKAKNITLCPTFTDWREEYHNATHVHIDLKMMSGNCQLPKKLRMLTSGGYNFNSECLHYVTSRSEIENIVDCFGTIYCPPPLAIKQLVSNYQNLPFKWINKFIKPTLVNDTLAFTTVDGDIFNDIRTNTNGKITTSDIVVLDDDDFYFVGSAKRFVRMNHIRYPAEIFEQLFRTRTGINDASLRYETIDNIENPVIIIPNIKDFATAYKFVDEFQVESKLKLSE
jgi:hypothetical protein